MFRNYSFILKLHLPGANELNEQISISENMGMVCAVSYTVNTLKSEENGPHYIHDNFRLIFLNKKKCILLKFHLSFLGAQQWFR